MTDHDILGLESIHALPGFGCQGRDPFDRKHFVSQMA